MSDESLPEPDRVEGAPHPRDTVHLYGQDSAQHEFLEAFNADRLHHGWLIAGPRGVGKATFAYRIARFLLSQPLEDGAGDMFGAPPAPQDLHTSPEDPVARRIAAGAEPGLCVLRRPYDEKTKKLKSQITVDEVRRLNGFFSLSSADGGRRVVIVDSADEMNPQAANALLKRLEEPPDRATLLLITHQPSKLLPTIRSRCRMLRLGALGPEDMAQAMAQAMPEAVGDLQALAALTAGSVGEAIRQETLGGLALYAELCALFDTMPRVDMSRGVALAEAAAQRGAEEKRTLLMDHIGLLLARLARTGALGQPPMPEAAQGEAAMLMRLAPNPAQGRLWANCQQEVMARLTHGRAVNLDPAALLTDTLRQISQVAPR